MQQWQVYDRSAEAICNQILSRLPADDPDSGRLGQPAQMSLRNCGTGAVLFGLTFQAAGSPEPLRAAASASLASAGSDFDPVFFMIEARWFSTVRWLMPRSAAMFLLGWPARTSSMI